ncbi:CsiV family protein [Ferrimonas futtsuensis]|uniref:CsiV family protein n=1 Tax=Ferrimonas futtsuensis TaxID=364764 RepID=UPI00040D8E2C|nr:CsiV family protein [Ferrimonas futtsuensis]
MSKPLYRALFGLTALLGSGVSAAEEATWFEVELVVFERPQTTSERFPEELSPMKIAAQRDLLGPAVMPDTSSLELALSDCQSFGWQPDQPECQPQPDQPEQPIDLPVRVTAINMGDPRLGEPYLLPESEIEFDEALAKLKRGGAKLLLHTGWQQPVYSRGNSQAYRLYSGHNFADRYQADGRLIPEQSPADSGAFDLSWLMPQAAESQPMWQLDGWIRIYLNQFLHIDTQLQLREEGERPVPVLETGDGEPLANGAPMVITGALEQSEGEAVDTTVETEPFLNQIRLEQSRRVRSREIHYFDHPRLGMVVQIRRMTQPSKMPPLEATPTETLPVIESPTEAPASAQITDSTQ